MPKKGKKFKAALTDEEQLLLFQQKMLAEEEATKKKERLIAQFLKDKLAKEEHNSNLNLNKINTQWRTVLREVKNTELHKDLEILSQTFERVVDCKDNVIKSLAKDLTEAEEQYAHALRSHLHNLDQLLTLQRRRLSLLEENYNMELEALTNEFEKERKTIIDQHDKEIRYLQDVFMAMEQNYMDSEYESKLEFQSMWDDLKNKNLEEKHFLRLKLENIVEDLWRKFQDALKNYTDATEDRKVAFETLKVKDEKSSKEIEMQMKKIQKLQGEKVLKLAEICRKFETEEEKVLPFYSSILTPKEQEELEKQNPEELTEELAKVEEGRAPVGRCQAAGARVAALRLPPVTPPPAYAGLFRDGEFLEKIQQSEAGGPEPAAQAGAAAGHEREAEGDAQTVPRRHLRERRGAEPAQPALHREPQEQPACAAPAAGPQRTKHLQRHRGGPHLAA
nr:coiled-coil domain-containing protein 65 isoform X3 [Meriones unguiculatus]